METEKKGKNDNILTEQTQQHNPQNFNRPGLLGLAINKRP